MKEYTKTYGAKVKTVNARLERVSVKRRRGIHHFLFYSSYAADNNDVSFKCTYQKKRKKIKNDNNNCLI